MFSKLHQKESEPLLPKHSRRHADSFLGRMNGHRLGREHSKENCRIPDCPKCLESKVKHFRSEILDVKVVSYSEPRSSNPSMTTSPKLEPVAPHKVMQSMMVPHHQSHAPKMPVTTLKSSSTPKAHPYLHKITPSLPHPPTNVITDDELNYQPVWIPDAKSPVEANRPRTLVLCFDASSDQLDVGDSNIIQFLSFLKKDDKKTQVVYFQTGSISSTLSGPLATVKSQISKTIDSMFAPNLSSDVQDGYRFLVQNYRAGDRISIFGFSRGAYIARALAGMVQRVGLVPADNIQQIPFAWSLYLRDDDKAEQERAHYKRTFSTNVIIDFVGVWECVLTVGIIDKELPFSRNDTSIRVFRHALALDEHRANFMPNFYHKRPPNSKSEKIELTPTLQPNTQSEEQGSLFSVPPPISMTTSTSQHKETIYPTKDPNVSTDDCEVWFAGCHGDVGGGYVKNGTAHSLARISLRWMIRECFRMKTGIIFDARMLQEELGLDWTTVYPEVKPRPARIPAKPHSVIEQMKPQGWGIVSFIAFLLTLIVIPIRILLIVAFWPIKSVWLLVKYTAIVKLIRKYPVKWLRRALGINWIISQFRKVGAWFDRQLFPISHQVPEQCYKICMSEEDHELWDALSPMHDRLKTRRFWTIMEYLPLHFVQQKNLRDEYYIAFNCGQGRKIYGDALHNYVVNDERSSTVGDNGSSSALWNALAAAEAGSLTPPHTAGTYRQNGMLKVHRSVKTRLEVTKYNGRSVYKPLAWWYRRRDLGRGKKGRKVRGPDRWNIEHPDPVKYWEWVD